jgi:hypothetical protein
MENLPIEGVAGGASADDDFNNDVSPRRHWLELREDSRSVSGNKFLQV